MTSEVRRLLEVLSVIVSLGVLAMLLLTATSCTRESSRRDECTAHLKLLGLALHNYHDVHHCFPPMRIGTYGGSDQECNQGCMSGFVSMLPFLGYEEIFFRANRRNFAPVPWMTEPDTWTTRIPELICSSDEEPADSPFGCNSYKMCLGTSVLNNDTGSRPEPNGMAYICMESRSKAIRIRDIRDGTANTLALSESRLGNPRTPSDIANVADEIDAGSEATVQQWWDACWNTADQYEGKRYNDSNVKLVAAEGAQLRGQRWSDGRPYFSGFTTIIPPNGPSCSVGGIDTYGVWTASSRHPKTVNAVLLDGSVRSISNKVDLRTWWGLGTRNMGETLGQY